MLEPEDESSSNSHFQQLDEKPTISHSQPKTNYFSCFSDCWFSLLGPHTATEVPLQDVVIFRDHDHNESGFAVRLLSYDLFIRCPGVTSNSDDFKDERLQEFINKVLPEYDIICLHQVYAAFSTRQRRLIEAARENGFYYHHKANSPSIFSVDGGLLILSKFPILESDILHFNSDGTRSWTPKCVIYARIQLSEADPDASFHVFLTQTEFTPATENAVYVLHAEALRLSQLRSLKAFIKEKSRNDSLPILLTGGFNINARKNEEDGSAGDGGGGDGGSTVEYENMLEILESKRYRLTDVMHKASKKHPVTYGDVEVVDDTKVPQEMNLTTPESLCSRQCLDYIFWLQKYSDDGDQSPRSSFSIAIDSPERLAGGAAGEDREVEASLISICEERTSVVPFFVEKSSMRPFTQLSHRYGIETLILYEPSEDSLHNNNFSVS